MHKTLTAVTIAMIMASTSAFAFTLPTTTDYNAKAQYYLNKIDTDKDGKISKTEHEAFAQQMFTAADTNNDGYISLDELTAAKKKEAADENAGTGMTNKYNNVKKDLSTLRSHLTEPTAQ